MSLAASLLMLAAAAVPLAAKPAPPAAAAPAPQARHGVVATASATAVILRPAVISFSQTSADPSQQRDAIYRQTSRRDGRVSIEFN